MSTHSVFWDDLEEDLKDPEFLREFVLETVRVRTIDSIINILDDARNDAHLSKAELARAISANPATVRRLLSSGSVNPTLGTVSEMAAALGYRLTLEPLSEQAGSALTAALVNGQLSDAAQLHAAVEELAPAS